MVMKKKDLFFFYPAKTVLPCQNSVQILLNLHNINLVVLFRCFFDEYKNQKSVVQNTEKIIENEKITISRI